MNHTPVELNTRRLLLGRLLLASGLGAMGLADATEPDPHRGHVDHGGHLAEAADAPVKRSLESYVVPRVALLDQFGKKVMLDKELDDGRTVILNFIYTSCAAICPAMTQIFAQVQGDLALSVRKLHMMSVSIDPEYDTPARLLAYAKVFHAGPQWDFYTGTNDASIAVLKAFDAYRGDKMNHSPLTLVRGTAARQWVRLDGFASPKTIVAEYRGLAR